MCTEERTSADSLLVSGAAPVSTAVKIYVEGRLAAETVSSKAGNYTVKVPLGERADGYIQIKGECLGKDGNTLSSVQQVLFKNGAPELSGFRLYTTPDASKYVDLYGLA